MALKDVQFCARDIKSLCKPVFAAQNPQEIFVRLECLRPSTLMRTVRERAIRLGRRKNDQTDCPLIATYALSKLGTFPVLSSLVVMRSVSFIF